MFLADLPLIDEHSVTVAAPPGAVWDAVLRRFGGSSARGGRWLARALGADPADAAGHAVPARPERPAAGSAAGAVGSTVPGFRVVAADRPGLLVVSGRHRFSRYGIVFRIEPAAESGARCSAESRAEFPGPHGRLYRLAVIGSGGHVVAVRRLLDGIKRSAERG